MLDLSDQHRPLTFSRCSTELSPLATLLTPGVPVFDSTALHVAAITRAMAAPDTAAASASTP